MIYHLTRPAEGGMLRVLAKVLEAYSKAGFLQEIWSNDGGNMLKSDCERLAIPGRYWPLENKLSLKDPLAFFLQYRLKKGIVFYHGLKSFLVANPGNLPAVLCLYNSLFPPYGNSALRKMAVRFAGNRLGNLKRVVVASNSLAKEACRFFPDVEVIPSGVDTSLFVPGTQRKVVGFLGRLRKEKGVELLLEVAKHFRNWQFEFAGPDLDGYAQTVQSENVSFLGKVAKPWQIIKSWSIMVLPSQTEAMPLSILEGMSCGLCIIATDTGDIKEMLGEGKFGIVIPVDDKKALHRALETAIADDAIRSRLGENARKKAKEYDWSRIVQKWLLLIKGLGEGV